MPKRIYRKPSPDSIKSHPLYNTWAQMKGRCYNRNRDNYHLYGGRGIRICPRWKESFACFAADMGPSPTDSHTVDRKNTNGHYTCGKCEWCIANGQPANCRWSTSKEQNRNRRNNRILKIGRVSRTIAEWSEALGISFDVLYKRITSGMPLKKAIAKPVRKYTRKSP